MFRQSNILQYTRYIILYNIFRMQFRTLLLVFRENVKNVKRNVCYTLKLNENTVFNKLAIIYLSITAITQFTMVIGNVKW